MRSDENDYVWLRQACEQFGPDRLIASARREERAIRRNQEKPPEVEFSGDPAERTRLALEILRKIVPPRPAQEALRAHVARMLYTGELEARGILVSPTPGAGPEPVPRHMFSDPLKIAWAGSRIKKSGRIYEEIEVRLPTPNSGLTRTPRANGRPSKQDEILGLIELIAQSGVDLNSMLRKEACARIREEAEVRGLNAGLGYSDPVLKRALTRKFGHRR